MKIYCTDCGQPTDYISAKPNFCQSCGKPFNKSKATVAPKPKRRPARPVEEEEEDDGTESVTEVPTIDKLDIEIKFVGRGAEKFGDLGLMSPNPDKFVRPTSQLSKEQLLEQFKKEGSALRPGDKAIDVTNE